MRLAGRNNLLMRMNINIMNKDEKILHVILGEFFTEYPDDLRPFDLLRTLCEDCVFPHDAIIWEEYEQWGAEALGRHIKGIYEAIERAVNS